MCLRERERERKVRLSRFGSGEGTLKPLPPLPDCLRFRSRLGHAVLYLLVASIYRAGCLTRM